MAKKSQRRPGRIIAVLLILLAAAAVWFYTQRRAQWDGWLARLHPALSPSVSSNAAPAGCFVPQPALNGAALQRSKQAAFATVEQLPHLPAGVYRIEAHLVAYSRMPGQNYEFVLASLTNPALTVTAELPAGSCIANTDDGALFDELRQDIDLRFGAPAASAVHPPGSPVVIVTGVLAAHQAALSPILDFRVQ